MSLGLDFVDGSDDKIQRFMECRADVFGNQVVTVQNTVNCNMRCTLFQQSGEVENLPTIEGAPSVAQARMLAIGTEFYC